MTYEDEIRAAQEGAVAKFWAQVDAQAPDPANAIRLAADLVGQRDLDLGKRRKLDGDLRLLRARLEARRQLAQVELAENRSAPWLAPIRVSVERHAAAAKVTAAVLENASARNRVLMENLTERVAGKRMKRSPLPVLRAIARSSCACGCREAAQEWLAAWTKAKDEAKDEAPAVRIGCRRCGTSYDPTAGAHVCEARA